jgi:3-oxoacid CoA-transferase A subunit
MINKIYPSIQEAFADITDGASIMVGGFGFAGTPYNLVKALIDKGVRGLTIISQSFNNVIIMADGRQVKKAIMTFTEQPARSFSPNPLEAEMRSGKIEVELVPQGTLAERIRAGGAGLAGFFTPTGVGTVVERGKEKRIFDDKEYIFERALKADFALIKAYKADRKGNLIYRKTARNFNPIMAMAARVTICEVEEVVEVGMIDPEAIITPGIFVDRVVQIPPLVALAKRYQRGT